LKIPFHIPFLTGKEEHYISDTINSIQSDSMLSYVEDCEVKLAKLTKSPYVLLTGSCTQALEMSLMLLDIKDGDEIICPSFTYVSVVNVILSRGAIPVFIDCKLHDCNIDERLIEKGINSNTRAVIIMHYAGVACDLNKISAITAKYEIPLIEDAAHCIHAYHEEKHLGTIGDFGAISFHKTKNIHCIQGGALMIKSREHYQRALILRDMGTNKKAFVDGTVNSYTWVDVGNSFSINPLSASFLNPQLERAIIVVEKRKQLWDHYNTLLHKINKNWQKDTKTHNGHIYYILCSDEKERNQLIMYLKQKGIDSRFHYIPLHSSRMGQKYTFIQQNDISSTISKSIIRLPLYYKMTLAEVELVVKQIQNYYTEKYSIINNSNT